MRPELLGVALITLCALCPAPAAAQQPGQRDASLVYRREVFQYQRAGRPDPFRSLLNNAELGVRFEDLTLLGVVHDPQASRSVAVLAQRGTERRLRVRVGDRVGNIRVVAIRPNSVDLVVEEFGVPRRHSLQLKPAAEKGQSNES